MDALPPELEALATPGTVLLDKYRVEGVLGVGGMGAVVAAMHLQLEERVAIKFLLGPVARNPEMVQRFLREGRSAIKIRSEHCVRVLDVGLLPDGSPYMVMEHLSGRDLEGMIATMGPLPIPLAIDFILQAGEALAEAHMIGIVHRDLKPANLFVAERADGSPCVKVLDFGISKQSTPEGADLGMTKTQTVMGSPLYMSPEQMRSSKDVDARSDIWALGAVLYESLSAEPPFNGSSVTELCARILQDEPPPLSIRRPDMPPQLAAAIGKSLEKNRDRRYSNMAEFAVAIAAFGTQSARTSAERITRVVGGHRAPAPSYASDPNLNLANSATQSQPGMLPQSAVAVSSYGTKPSSGKKVVGIVAAVLVPVLVVGVAITFVALRKTPSPPGATNATTVTAEVPAPPPSIPPPLETAAVEDPTPAASAPSASASAVAASTPTVKSSIHVHTAHNSKPPPLTPPQASASATKLPVKPKDVFDDRN